MTDRTPIVLIDAGTGLRLPGGGYACRDDRPWTVERLDDEAARVLGLRGPDGGQSLKGFVEPADRAAVQAELDRARSTTVPYRVVYRISRADSRAALILDEGDWEHGCDGRPRRRGILCDISPCLAGSGVRTEAEQLLNETFAGLHEAALVIDADWRTILACNPAMESVLGHTAGELVGRTTEVLHLDREHFLAFGDRSRPGMQAEGRFRGEFPLRRKDGSRIDADIAMTALRARHSWGNGVLCIVRDVTEEKRALRALQNLAGHLQSAREQERVSVARELHDELGSSLTLMAADCRALQEAFSDAAPERRARIDGLRARVGEAADRVREVVTRLRPPLLEHLGLAAAVETYVDRFRTRTGIDCRLDIGQCPREAQDAALEIALFRVIQEALTNVTRHAGASICRIHLSCDCGGWRLEVRDDGRGVPPERVDDPHAYGLQGMRERLRHLGGVLRIHSAAETGTVISAHVPVARAPEGGDGR